MNNRFIVSLRIIQQFRQRVSKSKTALRAVFLLFFLTQRWGREFAEEPAKYFLNYIAVDRLFILRTETVGLVSLHRSLTLQVLFVVSWFPEKVTNSRLFQYAELDNAPLMSLDKKKVRHDDNQSTSLGRKVRVFRTCCGRVGHYA